MDEYLKSELKELLYKLIICFFILIGVYFFYE
jgi:hypothetical protein